MDRTGAVGKLRSVYVRDPDGNLIEYATQRIWQKVPADLFPEFQIVPDDWNIQGFTIYYEISSIHLSIQVKTVQFKTSGQLCSPSTDPQYYNTSLCCNSPGQDSHDYGKSRVMLNEGDSAVCATGSCSRARSSPL